MQMFRVRLINFNHITGQKAKFSGAANKLPPDWPGGLWGIGEVVIILPLSL